MKFGIHLPQSGPYMEAGIQHIVAEPIQRDEDSWLSCGEAFAKIFEQVAGVPE